MSFSEDIVPIFKGYCESCHQPGGQGYAASGLDLTSYDGLMKGTKFGPMVVPGKPDQSNLYILISGQAKIQMPYGHKLIPSCLQDTIYSCSRSEKQLNCRRIWTDFVKVELSGMTR
jgi:hypothetical protein